MSQYVRHLHLFKVQKENKEAAWLYAELKIAHLVSYQLSWELEIWNFLEKVSNKAAAKFQIKKFHIRLSQSLKFQKFWLLRRNFYYGDAIVHDGFQNFKLPTMGFKTVWNQFQSVSNCPLWYLKWIKFNYEAFKLPAKFNNH